MELTLLLADGRFPGGSHAHSGGLEAAVGDGSVSDLGTLEDFGKGRLATTGLVDAWFAHRACGAPSVVLARLEEAYEARLLSTPLREASRALGRGLRRSAAPSWPSAQNIAAEHLPLVLGAVVARAGGTPEQAAALAVHGVLLQVIAAAPKMLAVDMADAMAVGARLTPLCDDIAGRVADIEEPPMGGAPLSDLRSIDHVEAEGRLFVS